MVLHCCSPGNLLLQPTETTFTGLDTDRFQWSERNGRWLSLRVIQSPFADDR